MGKSTGSVGPLLARSLLHFSTLRVLMIVSKSFGELNQNFLAKLLLSTKSFRCDPERLLKAEDLLDLLYGSDLPMSQDHHLADNLSKRNYGTIITNTTSQKISKKTLC